MPSLDNLDIESAFSTRLQPDEKLKYSAYGIRQSILLFTTGLSGLLIGGAFLTLVLVGPRAGCLGSLVFYLLLFLLGAPLTPLIRKDYIVGLTDRRLLIARVKTPLWFKPDVNTQLDFTEYPRENLPPVKISMGIVNSIIVIDDAQKLFWARFPRAWSGNRYEVEGIATELKVS